MAKLDKQPVNLSCRHLGLAHDPFQREEDPNEEHRCYLWMQRDRIDPDHQRGYCLSDNHRHCPWLQISLPCQQGIKKVWSDSVSTALADKGKEAAGTLATASAQAAIEGAGLLSRGTMALLRVSGPKLRALASWIWANLPPALAWVRKRIAALVIAGLRTATRRAKKTKDTSHRPISQSPTAAASLPVAAATLLAGGGDFSMLMRLGREAEQAGKRKHAHLCFSKATTVDPTSEDAWLWMAATADDFELSLACLEKALDINPESGRARSQLSHLTKPAKGVQEQEEEAVADLPAHSMLAHGIGALDEGNEERAYQFFYAASKAEEANEAAWFWRAKTATDLGEVIMCLERVLKLNPQNEKARASLNWALDRQRMDLSRDHGAAEHPEPYGQFATPEPELARRSGLLNLGSTAYLVLGLLWAAAASLPVLDKSLASIYHNISFLPVLQTPYLSPDVLGLNGVVPEFNLFMLLPAVIAILAFAAMEIAWSEHRLAPLYVAFVTAAGIVSTGLFVTDRAPSVVLLICTGLAGICSLAGRVVQHRRQRAISEEARRIRPGARSSAMQGLTRSAR